jgi:4'-phosphopantetheinyl transferase EntD
MQEHERILASLFTPDVAVACVDVESRAPDLSEFASEPWFQRAAVARQREFAGARACGARVLAKLGLEPVPIPRGAAGEPVWPEAVVGSISHADGLCVAVGAPGSRWQAIGVDVEPERSESCAFARRIGNEAELSALRGLGAPIERLGPVLLAAKEACYKLQFPLTRDLEGWARLEVLLAPDTFRVRLSGATGPLATGVNGRWRRALGFIWAGIMLHGV